MKSDRIQRRPNIAICVVGGASRDRAGFDRPRRRWRRFRADGRHVGRDGPAPAIGRRPIGHRRSARGSGRDLRRRSQRRQRDRALSEAHLYFRRRQRPDEHFRLGQGRTKNCGHPGLGRSRRRRVVEPPQRRDPRQRDSRAHGREHDHPHRDPSRRPRRRKRRSTSLPASSTIRRPQPPEPALRSPSRRRRQRRRRSGGSSGKSSSSPQER